MAVKKTQEKPETETLVITECPVCHRPSALEACRQASVSTLDIIGSGPLEAELQRAAVARGLDVNWLGELPNATIQASRSFWGCQVVRGAEFVFFFLGGRHRRSDRVL